MKKGILVFALTLLVILAGNTFANVMPFGITISTTGGNLQIGYRLNETCSSVTVQIYGPLPSETVIYSATGTPSFGANTVIVSGYAGLIPTGTIGVKVIAVDAVGHSTWTKISDDATIPFMVWTPRGCRINKNPGSPYFGLIYFTNATAATTASGRAVTRGIYAAYPDGSDPLNLGNTAVTGGVNWNELSYNSPYELYIGADDKIWISDWSDAHAGVWRAENADLSGTFTLVLDTTGAASSGLVTGLHGSVTGMLIEGTGANTVLYTSDEDMTPTSSIWQYNLGNGPFPWTTSPTLWVDKSVHTFLVNHTGANIYHDSQGRWWTNNYRASSDYPTLIAFSADRQTVVWDSKTIGNDGSNDPLWGCIGGFAIDEARNRVAVGGYNAINPARSGFTVFPFNPLPTGNLSSMTTQVAVDSTTIRAIDFDAAGNVITIDSFNEILRMYSPPDGPNSFSTKAGYSIDNGVAFILTPMGPFTVTVGQTKDFTISGGVAPYTWSLSTTGVGSLDTTAGTAVTFTGTGAGTVDVTVTDSYTPVPQQRTVSMTVMPTGAPLYIESVNHKDSRFEIFE
jgi:hypothetical protein